LQKLGYSFQRTSNGQEAVDLFKHSLYHLDEALPFDVILMDTEMPVLNGIEATRAIRRLEAEMMKNHVQLSPSVIIGLSGNARKEHMEEALEAGMQDYLPKPYELKELSSKMEKWI
jgi:CheY-like chemotaxis protein